MSNELERKHDSAPPRAQKASKAIFLHLWHILRHNLGWKLLALFLAVALWAGLITQDPTLTREKTFSDVPVTISGADMLKRNALINLTDLSANPPTVRLKVDVPQKEYENVTSANYNVRVDLSRVTTPGKQEVKITATSSSSYGTVVEVVPDTLQLDVEKYDTKYRIPVTVVRDGDPPSGYYGSSPSVDPPMMAISGPVSLVGMVSRAVAMYDQSALPAREGLVRSSVPIKLVDASGNEINSDLIEITSESVLLSNVVVEQTLYETKLLDLSQKTLTSGTPNAGYQVKNISISPSQIVVAGRSEVLSQMKNIFLKAPIDLNGVTESFTAMVSLFQPAEITYMSSTSVSVTVEIEPVRSNRFFESLRIETLGLADGYSLSLDKTRASVTINGPKLWLDKLKSSGIVLTADLTGLKEGVHNVPLLCSIADSEQVNYTYATDPAIVQATLTIK